MFHAGDLSGEPPSPEDEWENEEGLQIFACHFLLDLPCDHCAVAGVLSGRFF